MCVCVAVTIVSAVLMVTLVLSEASLYMTTHMEHHLVVDQTRSEALHIDVDIVFYAMPCAGAVSRAAGLV